MQRFIIPVFDEVLKKWKFSDNLLKGEFLLNNKDDLADKIANGRKKFKVIYSLTKTPKSTITFELIATGVKPQYAEDPNERGFMYKVLEYDMKVYMCSNTLKYFKVAPEFIYLEIEYL